jgi:hypothetical protein
MRASGLRAAPVLAGLVRGVRVIDLWARRPCSPARFRGAFSVGLFWEGIRAPVQCRGSVLLGLQVARFEGFVGSISGRARLARSVPRRVFVSIWGIWGYSAECAVPGCLI